MLGGTVFQAVGESLDFRTHPVRMWTEIKSRRTSENEHLRVFVLFYFLHALIAGAICDIMKVNHKEK